MLERSAVPFVTLPANDVVAGHHDPIVERAIALMRGDPAAPWTVDGLARAAGTSRATFARRFAAATGITPRAFLTLLRLHGAARHLARSEDGLAAVAALAGYATEFAFGRAFKRCFRVAPGTFRRSLARRSGPGPVRAAA